MRKKNKTLKGPAKSSTDEGCHNQLIRAQGVDIDQESSTIPWKSVTEDATVAAVGARGATFYSKEPAEGEEFSCNRATGQKPDRRAEG